MQRDRPTQRGQTASARTLAAALALLLPLPVAGGLRPAARNPSVGPNLRINALQAGQYGRVGNALAASADGLRLVAAWDDVQGTCGPPFNRRCEPRSPAGLTSVGVSTDGGRTWTDLGPPPPTSTAMAGGHSWLDRGGTSDHETFYLVSRARKRDSAHPQLGQVGFLVHRGQFEKGRFVWQDVRYLGPADAGDYWRGPNVAAAKDGSGRVYIALTNLRNICGRVSSSGGNIELMRSEDGGETWSKPVIVSADDTLDTRDPKDPRCGSWGHFQFTPTLALGPAGEIYVAWQMGPEFAIDWRLLTLVAQPVLGVGFSRSLDGGRTFSHPRLAAVLNSMGQNAPAGYSKDVMNDTPRMAVASAGPHRGRIYLTYASSLEEIVCDDFFFSDKHYSRRSSQVYLSWSDSRGQVWSGPLPVGSPVPAEGIKRFFPTVAVHPDGALDLVYFESHETWPAADPDAIICPTLLASGYFRRGQARSQVDLWWTSAPDGDAPLPSPVRVTSESSHWCDVQADPAGVLFANFGDYLGMVALSDRTLVVWPDGRDALPEAYFAILRQAR
jgi:hypothetical protein